MHFETHRADSYALRCLHREPGTNLYYIVASSSALNLQLEVTNGRLARMRPVMEPIGGVSCSAGVAGSAGVEPGSAEVAPMFGLETWKDVCRTLDGHSRL